MKQEGNYMSYSIIRVARVKSKTNTTGIQKHVQRENKNYENDDIDLEKSYLNYDLVNDSNIDFNQKIDEKIEQNYAGKRKIRNDAIKHIDGVITSDEYFFKFKSTEDIQSFFEDSKQFLENEYGKGNLLYATVHMDEKTPHMHYGFVPITEDGRLSAKEVIGNKKSLTEFQDRFNQYLNDKGYRLERGESKNKTERKHRQVEQYKSETKYHEKEKESARQTLKFTEKQVHKHQRLIDHYKREIEPIKASYDNMKSELEDWEEIKLPKLKKEFQNIENQKHKESKKIEDLKQEQDRYLDILGSVDSQIDEYKEKNTHEKAKLDEIRAKKQKEEEEYQNLINVLNEPVNDKYEYEYKKPSLFSKEKEATGKVIISEDNYKTLKKQAAVAKRIEPEFRRLSSNQERMDDQKLISNLEQKNRNLKQKNKRIESEKEDEKNNHQITKNIVKSGCKFIKEKVGEDIYQKGIYMLDNRIKQQFRNQYRDIVCVNDSDKNMFKQKDTKIKQKQVDKKHNRDKGFGLDK